MVVMADSGIASVADVAGKVLGGLSDLFGKK